MQQLTIIGNLTGDPVTRTTQSGSEVCTFTVAVNRREKQGQQPEADFFRVSAWNQLGKTCQAYLSIGRKVCVVGIVSAHAYTGKDGKPGASLEVLANEVEFLTPKADGGNGGYTPVEDQDLPWGN
jgi:single-strand DNA-binding protein